MNRRLTAAIALALLAGCAGEGGFVPGISDPQELGDRAVALLPPHERSVESVSVVRVEGKINRYGIHPLLGYDALIRMEGCQGPVEVRFSRSGEYERTRDIHLCLEPPRRLPVQ